MQFVRGKYKQENSKTLDFF